MSRKTPEEIAATYATLQACAPPPGWTEEEERAFHQTWRRDIRAASTVMVRDGQSAAQPATTAQPAPAAKPSATFATDHTPAVPPRPSRQQAALFPEETK